MSHPPTVPPTPRTASPDPLTRSALSTGSPHDADFEQWWKERSAAGGFRVTPVPFADLDHWSFDPATGDLGHASGGFFTVQGLRVRRGPHDDHHQPVINQPEIGVLGILVKEFDGVPHCLMQAKMEPGNANTLQLSPTVQATRSNFTRVHRGGGVRYLEYFDGTRPTRVLSDSLQSEQGAWFRGKFNRNMVVVTDAPVPEHPDFHWVTLRHLYALLHRDNLVNMDTRTVLGSVTLAPGPVTDGTDGFTASLLRSYSAPDQGGTARHGMTETLSWLADARTRLGWRALDVPLRSLPGWSRTPDRVHDDAERDFRIIGVRVEAHNREVTSWTQPLLSPRGHGLSVFLVRSFDGVAHVLVQARPEPGLRDCLELAPTVQRPGGVNAAVPAEPDELLAEALTEDPSRVRFDSLLSEEGGRFHHAQTRYRVVAASDALTDTPGPGWRWLTVHQLMALVRHGHYLNVEARSLLASLHGLW
ncbi:NDP-hexose 2,3-dehydratase family protein [Nocardiopsis sp. NPDC007018]|uniref:NDP-hexose 2,3-dehydratase family protein n=1 Tax=Nocardiopsis sp. NPDC007018 TaxID=3155721 RepID=UPI0033D4FC8C